MIDVFTFDYIMRIVGRLGLIFVLIGAYMLWHLPVLKKHTRQFFWLATVICLSGLIFTTVEFIFTPQTELILSLLFNAGSVWILAIYLNYRAFKIKQKVSRTKINQYTAEVNQKIEELKHES